MHGSSSGTFFVGGNPAPSRRVGFTLVELLVVIAIISILAAIAIMQFSKFKTQAYDKHAVSPNAWHARYPEEGSNIEIRTGGGSCL